MDILITFADGTAELRAANSYAHWADADRLRRYKKIGPNEIGEVERGSFFTIAQKRGLSSHCFSVWRITGQDPTTKALTGEWQSCRVETVEEQIARLTRERDEALARIANLREWAKRMHRKATARREAMKQRPNASRWVLGALAAHIDSAAGALLLLDGKEA